MNRISWITFICLALVLMACEHKELCYMHPHTAPILLKVDWKQFLHKEEPTGMTVLVYEDDGPVAETHITAELDSVMLYLPVGNYHSVVFNQSSPEFGRVSFTGMDHFHTAKVTIEPVTGKTWYVPPHRAPEAEDEENAEDAEDSENVDKPEKVSRSPEWIGTDTEMDWVVTPEMIALQNEFSQWQAEEQQQRSSRQSMQGTVVAWHDPVNIIYTLTVNVHIKGIYNLRSARASFSSLSDGYIFSTATRTEDKVTQLMEEWKLSIDDADPTQGLIKSTVQCFGLPPSHRGTPSENYFDLELLLVDNKTILKYPFEVGHKIEQRTDEHGNLLLELEVYLELDDPLPDVKPEGGNSGGFDATVDDWGPEENYEIQM